MEWQAIYVPADDLTDPAPATTFAHLDATTVLSRGIAELGIYPAVDPLDSTSRMLDPRIVGEEHYNLARQVLDSKVQFLEISVDYGVLNARPAGPEDAPGLQESSGHHCHSGHGRALGERQDHCRPRSQDPEVHVAAFPRRRGVHRHPGQVREPRRQHRCLQGPRLGCVLFVALA